MRNDRINEALLRKYIRNTLLEYGAIESSGLPDWGLTDKDLYVAFIQPFTDVVETAIGKSKEVLRRGRTLIRSAFEAIGSTLIPVFEAEYEAVFDAEEKDINSIRSEYKDVYDRTEKALGKAKTLAFFTYPGLLLPDVVKGTAKTAADVLNAASGGLLKDMIDDIGGPVGFFENTIVGRNVILEAEDVLEAWLQAVLRDPVKSHQLMSAIEKNVAPIKKKLIAVKEKKLNDALGLAQIFINPKSMEQLKKDIKGKVGSTDISKIQKELEDVASPEQVKQMMFELPESTTKFAKNLLIAPLEKELDELKKAGVKGDLIKKYSSTIQKINSL